MKSSAWLVLTALLLGCASKSQTTLTDAGAFPATDPYDHRQNPQYTTGNMAGFRSLYVDPDRYPASIVPVEKPLAPPIQVQGPELPDTLFPAIVVQADLSQLNEGHTFQDLIDIVGKGREAVVVNMPSAGLVFFPAPESEKVRARSIRRLGSTQFGDTLINQVGTIQIVDALPPAAANAMIQDAPEGNEAFTITLIPRLVIPVVPPRGDLTLENTATASAEIEINDGKVGVLGPLAHGKVLNVLAGTYAVKFTLPNGYSWSEKKMTSGAH